MTLQWLQELNEELKGYHYSIVELMKDTEVLAKEQAVLAKEQAVLDDHENTVDNLIERLEDLVVTTEPVRPHASTDYWEVASKLMRNQKRLRYLRTSIDKANGTVRFLEPTPDLDICLVGKNEKNVHILTKRPSDVVEHILSLLDNDTTSLNKATSMEN